MAFTILTKSAFLFINHPERKKNKDEASNTNFVRVLPGEPASVPDWVRDDPIFTLGCRDGNIMEVVLQPTSSKDSKDDSDAEGEALGLSPTKHRKRTV